MDSNSRKFLDSVEVSKCNDCFGEANELHTTKYIFLGTSDPGSESDYLFEMICGVDKNFSGYDILKEKSDLESVVD